MSGPEFFQTKMGHAFFERDVPAIRKALDRIADALSVSCDSAIRERSRDELVAMCEMQSDTIGNIRAALNLSPDTGAALVIERAFALTDVLRALRLVVAIADNPEDNPGARVDLDPKADEQVRAALRKVGAL